MAENDSMRNTDGFTIVIPTYNRAELLRTALQSVQSLRVPEGWNAEVLVIDNNSTDHTPDVAEDAAIRGPIPVRHIVERNQGLNYARNRGWREARFSHLIYLDDDMLVDPGWLESYVQAQRELAPDAVVGPVDPIFEEALPEWTTERMIQSVTSAYSQKGDRLILIPAEHAHELPGCNFSVLLPVFLISVVFTLRWEGAIPECWAARIENSESGSFSLVSAWPIAPDVVFATW